MYKLLTYGVRRLADGVFIPESAANADWRRYQDWLAAGNTPEAADPAPTPAPDYVGFIRWLPTVFSTPEILTMNAAYVSFPWFCQYGNADGMACCIVDALSTNRITPAQYALFQGAMLTYRLPVVLP